MYYRLHEIFSETQFLKSYDPFQAQKKEAFLDSLEAADVLGEFLESNRSSNKVSEVCLEISLWGNKCDLSLSEGKHVSQKSHITHQLEDLKSMILCDDHEKFWNIIDSKKGDPDSCIAIILDNAGFELFTDLCLADVLLDKVERIDFYVKAIPWFVSDALDADVHWLLNTLTDNKKFPVLKSLASRWQDYLTSGR